jgi:hypothetical protein
LRDGHGRLSARGEGGETLQARDEFGGLSN